MICKSQCQRSDRQHRIRVTAGRKDRWPGDEQVADPVNFAVRVDDTLLRVLMHPCCSHMMPSAVQVRWWRISLQLDVQPTQSRRAQFRIDDLLCSHYAADVDRAKPPV